MMSVATHYQLRLFILVAPVRISITRTHRVGRYIRILDGPRNVYCVMSYIGLSCEDIYNNNPETGSKNGYYPINNNMWIFNMTLIAVIADGNIILSCAGVDGPF